MSNDTRRNEWDPRAAEVRQDQIAAYDAMRQRCPVAHSTYLHWSVFGHADVLRVLHDPDSFSNAVSTHVAVPNGMDPPQHTAFREIVDRYFTPAAVAAFEPTCTVIARVLVSGLPDGEADVMELLAEPFAQQVQCAFMGWPGSLHEPLRKWVRRNQHATLSGDREAMAGIALEFDGYIRAQLDARRQAGDAAPDDATTRLCRERVDGRLITDDEIVSIVRNWTVGELGTIAASVGILAHYLAMNQDVQAHLRGCRDDLPRGIDEILRIHAPLIANRRITTCPVELGGRALEPHERVSVLWASANRDEAVFGDPDEFRLDRDPAMNLLYGAGIHDCPGAPLARLELNVVMNALLDAMSGIEPVDGREPTRAQYPTGGFTKLPLRVVRRS